MNRIDHRILVHSTPEMVWSFLSSIENNPAWQVNCRELSFLTSTRTGQGTRWRMIDESGRTYIVEITAWYNQLGYEYVIVDGSPYKHNQGRIRLQEIAEGTIIEWSFSYELGGLLSGVRNALMVRRSIENMIVDSLWTLWRQIGQAQSDGSFQAKSLMRDAPDVEQRASYKPRHPVVLESTTSPSTYKAEENVPFIAEPPVTQDDTRPRPPVTDESEQSQQTSATTPERESVTEPDFLSDMSTSEFDRIATPEKYTPEHMRATTIEPVDITPPEEPEKAQAEPSPEFILTKPEKSPFAPPRDTIEDESQIVEPAITQDDTAPRPAVVESRIQQDTPDKIEPHKADEVTEVLPKSAEIMPKSYDKEDTGQISVFDLFGIPKPSETQQMEAVTIPQETAPAEQVSSPEPVVVDAPVEVAKETPPVPEAISVAPTTLQSATQIVVRSGRTGRRYILRQQLVNLRRP
ncbi:MAG: SRPBCC family protein [Aggregatilineales bacterium]